MKYVDHPYDSVEFLTNPKPKPFATVGVYNAAQPMSHNVQMKGRIVSLRTIEWEFEVEVLDNAEDTQSLYEQNKYPSNLGQAAIDMLKQNSHPYALPIFAGKVKKCVPLAQLNGKAPISEDETIAFTNDQIF